MTRVFVTATQLIDIAEGVRDLVALADAEDDISFGNILGSTFPVYQGNTLLGHATHENGEWGLFIDLETKEKPS